MHQLGERGIVGAALEPELAKERASAKSSVRLVNHDSKQPGAKGVRFPQQGEIAYGFREGVLHDVLGVGAMAQEAQRRGPHHAHVASVERLFGPLVPPRYALDEVGVRHGELELERVGPRWGASGLFGPRGGEESEGGHAVSALGPQALRIGSLGPALFLGLRQKGEPFSSLDGPVPPDDPYPWC